ncbi:MAG: ketoacyl-ACP synthase III, partial [Oscillospiraceae bacterium]|nr:ketoacyl-ACP synthase III [Oscillospiraceae bacterium]
FLASGQYKTILIVSSEKLSSQQDYTDRSMCILFGDAAGAVVVRSSDRPYFSKLGATGDDFEALYCKVNYQSNCPFYPEDRDNAFYNHRFDTFSKQNYLQSDGHAVYKFAVNAMSGAVKTVAADGGYSIDDIDLIIPHQANLRIIKKATDILGADPAKVYTNIERLGNVSSACIPVALDELNRQGRLHKGMKLCIVGFGAGLTYGAIIMEL